MILNSKGNLDALFKAGDWKEFETYLAYWLSGLSVVVEGIYKA